MANDVVANIIIGLYPVVSYLENILNYKYRNNETDLWIKHTLSSLKSLAVSTNNQYLAKEIWKIEIILEIQSNYIFMFGLLKKHEFYEGWCILERIENKLNFLQKHFSFEECYETKMELIYKQVIQFQDLFPYKYFISPAFMHSEKRCTICGNTVGVQNYCGHIAGEIYNGEMCAHEIIDGKFLELSIVTNPVQKYSVLFLSDSEKEEFKDNYDYSLVNYVISAIRNPFDVWFTNKTKTYYPHQMFSHISVRENCPCGSGKIYKNCCLKNPKGVIGPHIKIYFASNINPGITRIKHLI